jgi:hypothetical protein
VNGKNQRGKWVDFSLVRRERPESRISGEWGDRIGLDWICGGWEEVLGVRENWKRVFVGSGSGFS